MGPLCWEKRVDGWYEAESNIKNILYVNNIKYIVRQQFQLSGCISNILYVNNFNYLAASTVQVILLHSGAGRLVPLVVFSSFHYSEKNFTSSFSTFRSGMGDRLCDI